MVQNITDLVVFHNHKQKQTNQCATSNGGCSHLCLTLPPESPEKHVTYTCACPTHYTLEKRECKRKYNPVEVLFNYTIFHP